MELLIAVLRHGFVVVAVLTKRLPVCFIPAETAPVAGMELALALDGKHRLWLNSFASPLWGVIWSTTVAFTKHPCFLHSSQRGCAFKKRIRARFHLPSYPRTDALARSEACSRKCSSQYIPSVSFGHPGCLHGFIGLEDATDELKRMEELENARKELEKNKEEKPVSQKMFRAI